MIGVDVAVADYGIGNTGSVANIFKRLGARPRLAGSTTALGGAEVIVLPGVGAFDPAADALRRSGLVPGVLEAVAGGTPLLGVCLGMHLLADSSDEGTLPGLGLVPGRVRRLDAVAGSTRLPHLGWAELRAVREPRLIAGIDEPRFYFAHSYGFDCGSDADVVARAWYGTEFAAVVRRGNVWGAQFHPEKSGRNGLALLANFLAVAR